MQTNTALKNQAVGIDFGSQRIVIAVVNKGGVEVISNEATYRLTPSLVSFGQNRQMGDAALSNIKKNLRNSIFMPSRYLGKMTPTQLGLERSFNFCKTRLDENNKVVFNVLYEGETIDLSSEQVMAGMFTKIKQILRLNNIISNDFVISVPSYLTTEERKAFLDSAAIAEVNVSRLYNESTANVMNYGIFRKKDLDEKKERLVAFVDFGHSKSSIFVGRIWKNHAEIVYEINDRNLGTRNMDLNLLKYYVNLFKQKHKIDLFENPKSIFRLLKDIEKQRKILTGNKVSNINIECLFEDYDFHERVERSEFENINKNIFSDFEGLVAQAVIDLKKMGINLKDLHSVERIGGGSRIPLVEEIIKRNFGIQQVSKTLDASESIARGCAIQSAMLCSRYHVQPFKIKERTHYPINIKLQYEDDKKQTFKTLFKVGSDFNKVLSLTIKKAQQLSVQLEEEGEHHKTPLLYSVIKAMKPKSDKYEGKLCIQLDRNGLVNIQKMEMMETEQIEEKVPKKKKKKEKSDEKDKQKMEVEEEEEFEIKKKTKTTTSPINYTQEIPIGLPQSVIENKNQVEKQMLFKQNLIKETQDAKYSLESFIYETRNKIQENKNLKYLEVQERNQIIQELAKQENWLYEGGMNCSKDVYLNKLKELQDYCGPFYSRFNKIKNIHEFLIEATPAFDNFENFNADMLTYGSNLQRDDVKAKVKESQGIIQEMQKLQKEFCLKNIDSYDYGKWRKIANSNFELMTKVVKDIKNEKETKEKAEREAKEKIEREAKEKADKEKADKEAKENAEKEEKKQNDGQGQKMDIEEEETQKKN